MPLSDALWAYHQEHQGVRKGVEDMGVLGNPGKYGLVIAENEEGSPWSPLHVEHGFSKRTAPLRFFP